MKKPTSQPVIKERVSSGLFIREVRLAYTGDFVPGHVHNYDHTMFFMKGRARVTLIFDNPGEGDPAILAPHDVEAPFDMLVEKDVRHRIEALDDGVVFLCVFPHRDIGGNITDAPDFRGAYN